MTHIGRTSLRRGVIALVVAPMFAFAPLSLLLLATAIGGRGDPGVSIRDLYGLLPITAMALAMVEAMTVVFGGAAWMALRLLRWESGRSYALAGSVLGLLWAFRFGYAGRGALRVDQMLAFGLCVVVGGTVALAFWRIARDPRS
jgi:hypothetical protein